MCAMFEMIWAGHWRELDSKNEVIQLLEKLSECFMGRHNSKTARSSYSIVCFNVLVLVRTGAFWKVGEVTGVIMELLKTDWLYLGTPQSL